MSSTIVPHLEVFHHELFERVRTAVIDGEVWFIARDVAKALGKVHTANASH